MRKRFRLSVYSEFCISTLTNCLHKMLLTLGVLWKNRDSVTFEENKGNHVILANLGQAINHGENLTLRAP